MGETPVKVRFKMEAAYKNPPPQFFSTFGFFWSNKKSRDVCEPDNPRCRRLLEKSIFLRWLQPRFNVGGRQEVTRWYCWWFRNPAITSWYGKYQISHYLQGFIHPRWLFGMSSINSVYWGLNSYWFLTKNWILEFQSSPMTSPNALAFLCLKQEFLGKILPWRFPKIWIEEFTLKIDAWKMILSFWGRAFCQGRTVKFQECTIFKAILHMYTNCVPSFRDHEIVCQCVNATTWQPKFEAHGFINI